MEDTAPAEVDFKQINGKDQGTFTKEMNYGVKQEIKAIAEKMLKLMKAKEILNVLPNILRLDRL